MTVEAKRCARCENTKPATEFRRDKRMRAGLSSWCLDCYRAYEQERNLKRRPTRRVGRPPKALVDGKARCSRCQEWKPTSEYQKDRSTPLGIQANCKTCVAAVSKVYRSANQTAMVERAKAWNRANPTRHKQLKKESDARRRPHINERFKRWARSSPSIYIGLQIRVRLANAVRRQLDGQPGKRAGSAVRDLGCTLDQLMQHLERQFKPGMSWDNYGDWHIDHIKPLARYDLTDRAQLLEACHFTNLQPLWASENISKGAKTPAD